jgi:Bacterial Alpha-2-macroglobulin MG10 domain/Alpha-2-macroglobulin family/MG2 domain
MQQNPLFRPIASVFALLLTLFSCQLFTKKQTNTMPVSRDFKAEWSQVDSLEQQGLPESALAIVTQIAEKAKESDNDPQWVKTVLVRTRLTLGKENGIANAIQLLEKDAAVAMPVAQAILRIQLAELYYSYLNENGWRLAERTPVANEEKGDVMTWSAAQIEKRMITLLAASMEPAVLLEAIPANDWMPVLIAGTADTIGNQPIVSTLLDVLGRKATQNLANERMYLTEPVNAFRLTDPNAFAADRAFAAATFTAEDAQSTKLLALKIYQQLTLAHLKSANRAALVDLNISRLSFVKNTWAGSDANSKYLNALKILRTANAGFEGEAEVLSAMSEHVLNNGLSDKMAAYEWLREAVNQYPTSYGGKRAKALLANLERPEMSVTVESAVLPDRPFLTYVNFTNVNKIRLRLVKASIEMAMDNAYQDQAGKLTTLLASMPVWEQTVDLKAPRDFASHGTELMLPALKSGQYALLATNLDQFDPQATGRLTVNFVNVTNMAFVSFNADEVFLVQRDNGQSIPNARVGIYQLNWGVAGQAHTLAGETKTDEKGRVIATDMQREYSYIYRAYQGDDSEISGYYNRPYETDESVVNREATFFLDRSIYRPGQMVYFKGILLQRPAKGQPQILPNRTVTVRLRDANYQEVVQMALTTNEFGTFNGVIKAPASGLTGGMTLSVGTDDGTEWGSTYFNVEEYKRPRFEVSFAPFKDTYRLDDVVSTTITAQNLAGFPTANAEVKWRVVRNANIYLWWRSFPIGSPTPEQEIAYGTGITDENGQLKIQFNATSPEKTDENSQFTFTLTADVSAIDGEMRSASTSVGIGVKSLNLNWELADQIHLDSVKVLNLTALNLDGKAVSTAATVQVQALKSPNNLLLSRLWTEPDVWVMDEATYKANFPNHPYKKEADPTTWPTQGSAQSTSVNLVEKGTINLSQFLRTPGHYRLTATAKDKFGQTVKTEKIVKVWHPEIQFDLPDYFVEKNQLKVGESAKLTIGSAFDKLVVHYAFERQGKPFVVRSNTIQKLLAISETVAESDKGGLFAHWFTVRDNRIYFGSVAWEVPFADKMLNITYETFRDKLEPGSEEAWRIRVSGPNKEKVAAELAAAMYDASLDQFVEHRWDFSPFNEYYMRYGVDINRFYANPNAISAGNSSYTEFPTRQYLDLVPLGYVSFRRDRMYAMPTMPMEVSAESNRMVGSTDLKMEVADAMIVGNVPPPPPLMPSTESATVPKPIRDNLKETVFFFPALKTDANGDVLLSFKMNEALTRWKLLLFAHSKSLQYALSEKTVVTQKAVMITANPPRFLRAGDELTFPATVINLTQQDIMGNASLALADANTLAPLEKNWGFEQAVQPFNVPAGQSKVINWTIKVPENFTGALNWQVFADSKAGRDGEANTLPVLTNRTLVTETLPITLRGNQSKTFSFAPMKQGVKRENLCYTLEMTNNPAWYAVQSLPYLMEYPHECSEQIFSRFYANKLAQHITQQLPAIRRVYERWATTGQSAAMQSNLSKNQELKSALLAETPWVLDAQNEEQQRQQIALLFDLNRMADEEKRALDQLAQRAIPGQGWAWFPGGQISWPITQQITVGLFHLERLGAFGQQVNGMQLAELGAAASSQQLERHYADIKKRVEEKKDSWDNDHLDPMVIQFLYMRSFHPEWIPSNAVIQYFEGQIGKFWQKKGLYEQAMLALAAHRLGRSTEAQSIVRSLRERAVIKDEMGMYWPTEWGNYWYQLPIETQALMVEVFQEVAQDKAAVENLRIWLLKNKQTNQWSSTKATAHAVYALLLKGEDWLTQTQPATVKIGAKAVLTNELEAGTGYFKQQWTGADIQSNWNTIEVNNPNAQTVWGAAYWQYLAEQDEVGGSQNTGLKLTKQIYRQTTSNSGPVLTPLANGNEVKVGDRLVVRVEIRADRAMEFVHLKDLRAAGCEPIDVLSRYQWKNGLGFYQSTKDVATHFFFDYLPAGTHVMEYTVAVTHPGDQSLGFATMQCMYAPEFSSRSAGLRLKVVGK